MAEMELMQSKGADKLLALEVFDPSEIIRMCRERGLGMPKTRTIRCGNRTGAPHHLIYYALPDGTRCQPCSFPGFKILGEVESFDPGLQDYIVEHAGPIAAAPRWLLAQMERGGEPVACSPAVAAERPRLAQSGQGELSFPDVIRGVAGDFARLYSAHIEVPEQFFFIGFLTCLGSVFSDRLTLVSEIAPQPRLYVLLLGESADERKSTALVKVTNFFADVFPLQFNVCWGVGSAEGLQNRLKENDQLLLCLDEFKQFISKCKIQTSVLLPCVNTLFESNRYESRTKTTDICLEEAYLSLLSASTLQTYERVWDSNFLDIGFNNRLFLVPGSGERKYSIPRKVPDEEKIHLHNRLNEVACLVGEHLELEITPDARARFDDWYMNLERSIHTKRLDTYAMRFMPLLAVNQFKREVDEETVAQAIALADWQLKIRQIHDPIDADSKIARLEEKIRRHLGNGAKSERDLRRSTNANRDGVWTFRKALGNLHHAGDVRWNAKSKLWELAQQ